MNTAVTFLASCGWTGQQFDDFIRIAHRPSIDPTLLDEDPLIHLARPNELSERVVLASALARLHEAAARSGHQRVDVPRLEDWLIDDQGLFQAFAIGHKAIISRPFFEHEDDLTAVLAYIMGWFNGSGESGERDTYPTRRYFGEYLVAVRYAAVPFHHEDELPGGYREDILLQSPSNNRRYQHRDKSMPKGHPEDLRPKPVGVLLSGGNNYKNFAHVEREQTTRINFYIQDSLTDVDSTRAVQAAKEYVDLLPDDVEGRLMQAYFYDRWKWAEFFKYCQAEADRYACDVLGQGEQLASLLERHMNLYTGEYTHTTLFGRPFATRIGSLRGDPQARIYRPAQRLPPRNRMAEIEEVERQRLAAAAQVEAERKAQLEKEQEAREKANRERKAGEEEAKRQQRAMEREPIRYRERAHLTLPAEFSHIRGFYWYALTKGVRGLKGREYNDRWNLYYVFDHYAVDPHLEVWSPFRWPHIFLLRDEPLPRDKNGNLLHGYDYKDLINLENLIPNEDKTY